VRRVPCSISRAATCSRGPAILAALLTSVAGVSGFSILTPPPANATVSAVMSLRLVECSPDHDGITYGFVYALPVQNLAVRHGVPRYIEGANRDLGV